MFAYQWKLVLMFLAIHSLIHSIHSTCHEHWHYHCVRTKLGCILSTFNCTHTHHHLLSFTISLLDHHFFQLISLPKIFKQLSWRDTSMIDVAVIDMRNSWDHHDSIVLMIMALKIVLIIRPKIRDDDLKMNRDICMFWLLNHNKQEEMQLKLGFWI